MIVSPRGRARQGRIRNDSFVEQLSAGTGWRRTGFPPRLRLPCAAPWYVVGALAYPLGTAATVGLGRLAGVLRAGNDPERVIAALVQAFPDMGFPRAANAIRILGEHLRDQEREQE